MVKVPTLLIRNLGNLGPFDVISARVSFVIRAAGDRVPLIGAGPDMAFK